MAQPGILSWATSVRATMVNDPCRQSLEDQIQMHGFLFLDDYLDNILAQAKQDPIINLVKTPGRKKVGPKRTRAGAATAKAKSAVTLSAEENDTGKENQAPVNSFHQALLQAKNNDSNRSMDKPLRHQSNGILAENIPGKPAKSKAQEKMKEKSIIEVEIQEDGRFVKEILSSSAPPSPAPSTQGAAVDAPAPPPTEPANDLSVIAEDDELAERSVHVLLAKPLISATMANASQYDRNTRQTGTANATTTTERVSMEVDDDMTETANMTASSSGQTFHSIPLDSPEMQQSQQSTRPSGANSGYLTTSRTQMPPSHSGPIETTENEAMIGPLPSVESSASMPNIMSVPVKEPPTQFPSLPAPSPLRKSMRVQREPSMGVGPTPPMPAIANAVVGPGKRTSWLMKAREVKAMEAPGKQAGVLGPSAVAGTAPVPGLKRKSGEMLATATSGMAGMTTLEDNERKRKVAKTSEGDAMVSKEKSKNVGTTQEKQQKPSQLSAPTQPGLVQIAFPTENHEKDTVSMPIEVPKEGMMDRLKRTVEGLAGKTMTKSLGGPAAAAALAEAKAAKVAAEARIAERDGRSAFPSPAQETVVATTKVDANNGNVPSPKVREKKLSVSDLVTAYQTDDTGKSKAKTKEVGTGFKPVRPSSNKSHVGDESTSTTPPNSPPLTRTSNSSFVLPSGPVFNKPPVFVPPAPAALSKDFSFNLPLTAFALPAASSSDMPARLPSPSAQKSAPALSAHSTAASLFSDSVFESQNDGPAWMPSTQDTDYSIAPSEAQPSQNLDEDDSWPMVDEKLAAANPSWTPFGFTKEDSMTWSTLPTESQRDTRSTQNRTSPPGSRKDSSVKHIQVALDMEVDNNDQDLGGSKVEDPGLEHDGSIAGFAKELERSQSQMSMASTSSSQSQIGWVGQATKLVSSVLGGSKSKKPQVPSLQRAAAAAKKEQEEKDKKASRMKEMESRRQFAIQRKVEEEKSKAMEEEKKIKEDGEKRKREREETTDKRPLKAGSKKVEEDTTKKRKITVDVEKKPIESKKPPSKEKKDIAAASRMLPPLNASTIAKPAALNKSGGGFKPSGSNPVLSSSATYNAQVAGGSNSTVKLTETKTIKASTTTSVKGKGKAKIQDDGHSQPTHQLQIQMAARAKAQIQAAKQQQAEAENIELPDINSEYSDSDDEDRPRTFDPPDWAQSPELRQQLHMQSTVNPDDIFGPIRPLKMEEVFRTRQSRFRARTSSANWTGNDRLTVEEEKDYARRMGFR